MRLGLMRRAERDWERLTRGLMGRGGDTEEEKEFNPEIAEGAEKKPLTTARISAPLERAEPRGDNHPRDYAETAIDVPFRFAKADSGAAGANRRGGICRGGDFLLARPF